MRLYLRRVTSSTANCAFSAPSWPSWPCPWHVAIVDLHDLEKHMQEQLGKAIGQGNWATQCITESPFQNQLVSGFGITAALQKSNVRTDLPRLKPLCERRRLVSLSVSGSIRICQLTLHGQLGVPVFAWKERPRVYKRAVGLQNFKTYQHLESWFLFPSRSDDRWIPRLLSR